MPSQTIFHTNKGKIVEDSIKYHVNSFGQRGNNYSLEKTDDDNGEGNNPKIEEYELLYSGEYSLEIQAWFGATGQYSVRYTLQDPPVIPTPTATPTPKPTATPTAK